MADAEPLEADAVMTPVEEIAENTAELTPVEEMENTAEQALEEISMEIDDDDPVDELMLMLAVPDGNVDSEMENGFIQM